MDPACVTFVRLVALVVSKPPASTSSRKRARFLGARSGGSATSQTPFFFRQRTHQRRHGRHRVRLVQHVAREHEVEHTLVRRNGVPIERRRGDVRDVDVVIASVFCFFRLLFRRGRERVVRERVVVILPARLAARVASTDASVLERHAQPVRLGREQATLQRQGLSVVKGDGPGAAERGGRCRRARARRPCRRRSSREISTLSARALGHAAGQRHRARPQRRPVRVVVQQTQLDVHVEHGVLGLGAHDLRRRQPIPRLTSSTTSAKSLDRVPAGPRAHQRVRVKRRTRGEGGATGNERVANRVRGERARRATADATARRGGDMARVGGGGS